MDTNGNYIQNQFCSYEIALKLKELGFDEECLVTIHSKTKDIIPIYGVYKENPKHTDFWIKAPLWQQVIDWFRKKHDIYIYIKPVFDNLGKSEMYQWEMKIRNRVFIKNGDYKDFYEAREQAILKAIELCQKEK